MECLLNFVRTEVPLRLVKWLATRFDVSASEFQLKKKFIPITKYDIHDIQGHFTGICSVISVHLHCNSRDFTVLNLGKLLCNSCATFSVTTM